MSKECGRKIWLNVAEINQINICPSVPNYDFSWEERIKSRFSLLKMRRTTENVSGWDYRYGISTKLYTDSEVLRYDKNLYFVDNAVNGPRRQVWHKPYLKVFYKNSAFITVVRDTVEELEEIAEKLVNEAKATGQHFSIIRPDEDNVDEVGLTVEA